MADSAAPYPRQPRSGHPSGPGSGTQGPQGSGQKVTHCSQLVEAGEELVEGHDELLGSALGRQAGEALDVSKQDARETGGKTPVRKEGQGDAAGATLRLRRAASQQESRELQTAAGEGRERADAGGLSQLVGKCQASPPFCNSLHPRSHPGGKGGRGA